MTNNTDRLLLAERRAKELSNELAERMESELTRSPEFNADQLIRICTNIIANTPERQKPMMVLPVDLPLGTKKNKARLITSDRSSPLGNVIKKDPYASTAYTTASASFNAFEVLAWLHGQEE